VLGLRPIKKTDGPLFVFVLHPRTRRSPPFEHYRNEHGRQSPTPVIFFFLTISMSLSVPPINLGKWHVHLERGRLVDTCLPRELEKGPVRLMDGALKR
jgi:hypothetical protein